MIKDFEKRRNQKDWIQYRYKGTKKATRWINIINWGTKYGWEVKITDNKSYPYLTKTKLTKAKALNIAKNFMKKY